TNVRLFPECVCGRDNTISHAANDCENLLKNGQREWYVRKMNEIFDRNKLKREDGLHEYLMRIYYNVDSTMLKRDMTQLIKLMKEAILKIVRREGEEDEDK